MLRSSSIRLPRRRQLPAAFSYLILSEGWELHRNCRDRCPIATIASRFTCTIATIPACARLGYDLSAGSHDRNAAIVVLEGLRPPRLTGALSNCTPGTWQLRSPKNAVIPAQAGMTKTKKAPQRHDFGMRSGRCPRCCAARLYADLGPEPRIADLQIHRRRASAMRDVETDVQSELARQFVAEAQAAAADTLRR